MWLGKCLIIMKYWKHDESAGTYTKLSTTYPKLGSDAPNKPIMISRSGNYDFALTGSESNGTLTLKLYKHTAGTDTWTGQSDIVNPTNKPTTNQDYGRFGASFTRDGNYLFLGSYGSYGGYSMYTIDWDANTAVFSGANRSAGDNIGHAGAVTPDGKYALLFHNDSNTRLIYKNNNAGDWSSATDVTSTFTFNNGDDDQGGGICFFGDHGQYYISRMGGSNVRIYKWLDVLNKEITLTYNGKDMLTLAHKGGLTTTSVKLYKDDILYHTFGASETSVVIAEAGVYQAIADEKYYSLKVTVTTVTETLARLYVNHATTFLLKKDGKVWYWGESHRGSNAMGNGTQVALPTLNDNLNALPSGIKQIGHSGTDPHAKCAITNDGKLYTWGYNGHGQLGRGNSSDYTSQGPWLVSTQSSNTFTFCHSSYYNNYALQDNGYVWVTGHGGHYINGLGNNSNINTFTRINLPNVIDIHANHNIALALTSDNEVYIWGTESNSSMGGVSGTTATPTHMTALDGKNIVKVRTGGYTGHAISSDGKMYSWGKGQYYAVPDGTNSNVGTPTEMTWFSRKNIKLVDAQFPYDEAAACLGLDDQGNMYVWGMSDHGAIGVYHHHPTTHSWPVLLKTNIASISVGRHSCGCIDKFGKVYTWGDGARGVQNWIHGSNSDTDINYPTSNNLSVGSSVVYDGFDKYLLGKDSTVTSNVTFGSNTVSLGTKSEVFISDPHTYKFKIMESGKTTYTSNVISSTPTRPTGRVYPPKSGTHKSLTTSGSANNDNTWTIDGALYGNGAYKASMDKNTNSSEHVYHAFSGVTGYGHMHTNNLGSTATAAIQLHMPQKIKLTKYAMYSRNFTGEYNYAPRDWKVYGSNDKTNWTELDSQTNETVTAWGSQLDHRDTKREYTVSGNTKYFSSYKLDVTANGGGAHVVISQIEYYGDEEGFLSDDGFGKLTLDVKGDTSATSNIVFHSNTYVMGAARDLYITDTGEYTADIFGSNKHFLGSKTHTVSANATEFIWKENEDQILYASDAVAGDAFGRFVSIDGNYAIVGAINGNAAYIFYKSGGTWTQQAILTGNDTGSSDEFGTCVGIKGDYAVVAARGNNSYAGAAYVFVRSGTNWTQQQKLTTSDTAGSDKLATCSIDGDYIILGAWGENSHTGAVYIFKRSGTSWSQQQKLTASDAAANDQFGISVSISGDYVIAGAYYEDTGGTDAGAAYIFKRGTGTETWTEEAKIQASDIAANDSFGYAVSIDGDTVVVGARQEDEGGTDAGAAYIFTRSGTTWAQQEKLMASDKQAGDNFGNSAVSISGNRVVVGAAYEDTNGSNAGAAYIFERSGTTWTEVKKILASDGQANDYGGSVAIDGTNVITGSTGEDTKGTDAGAAYIFSKAAKAVPALNFDGYNKLSIDNVSSGGGNEWPPTDGTASSFSVSNSNRDATWTISGASYGNGTYKSKWSANIIDANRHSGKAFNKIYGSNENFHANGTGAGNLDLELPEAFIMGSYDMRHRSNINTSEGNAPKDWVISGSNDGSTWTVLDTQTGQVYSPDVAPNGETLRSYTVTGNTTAYKHYRMYITSIDGGPHTVIGELRYYAQQTVATTYTIKKDDVAFATTTSNTVYIRDTGTYTAEVKGSGAYVTELSKTVGSITKPSGSMAISTHIHSAFATSTSGTFWVWGRNDYGYLGLSHSTDNQIGQINSNTDIGTVILPLAHVSGYNSEYTLVCNTIGECWGWGRNNSTNMAALGNTGSQGVPYKHVMPNDASTNSPVLITQCMAGNGSGKGIALGADSNVYTWGNGNYGQLGHGNTNSFTTPTRVTYFDTIEISKIGGGTYQSYALSSDGTLYAWGRNQSGALGIGNTSDSTNSTPTSIATGVKLFDCHAQHVVYAKTNNTVFSFGWNHSYQLGNGNTTTTGTHYQLTAFDNVPVKQVVAHYSSSQVLTESGEYWAWGENGSNQQLGFSGNSSTVTTPTKSTSASAFDIHSIGKAMHVSYILTTGGDIYTHGGNSYYLTDQATNSGATTTWTKTQNIKNLLTVPDIKYDGKNKISLQGYNYADTSTVTYYSNTYNLGTAKTMYVKDAGEYVFKISGTDKYVESNVHVSSVDLAGATTKPISFDGYNKLTLISPGENAVSNVTLGATTYDYGKCLYVLH